MLGTRLVVAFLCLCAASAAHASAIVGQLTFTGNFTLNHNFNFNSPTMPFGSFSPMTVQSATGLFSQFVNVGDVLTMNTPDMYTSSGDAPVNVPYVGTFFGSLPQPMQWTIDGYAINTLWQVITGPDSGRFCFAFGNLSGNGFNPADYFKGAVPSWQFTAPPYDISNFPRDITGPIQLQISVSHVPESGSTFYFASISLILVTFARRCAVPRNSHLSV